jgi:hypothetical protein
MKGLLRGMVAVGLLAGGAMGLGCSPEMGPRADTSKTPTHTRYQTPETQEAQPIGEGPISRPSTEGNASNPRATRGQGGVSPYAIPDTEGLGRALNPVDQAAPAQEGFGGAGQNTGDTTPKLDRQDAEQPSPASHGE